MLDIVVVVIVVLMHMSICQLRCKKMTGYAKSATETTQHMSLDGLSAGTASMNTDAEATSLLSAAEPSPSDAYSWVMTNAMASTALLIKWIVARAVLLIRFEELI